MAEHTHTPLGNYNGSATCARCLSPIANIYTARNNKTGAVETFGSDCHYHVTGIDTRQAKADQDRSARVARNRAEMPDSDLPILEEARTAAMAIPIEDIDRRNSCVWLDIRDWDARWTRGNGNLTEWLQMVVRNMNREGDTDGLARALIEGVTLVDFDTVTGKAMAARFPGICSTCSGDIAKGDPIIYNGDAHCARHGK